MNHVLQAVKHILGRVILAASGLQQRAQQLIELAIAGRLQRPDIQPAAPAEFQPALAEKIVIGGAHRIGMDLMAARHRTHAG